MKGMKGYGCGPKGGDWSMGGKGYWPMGGKGAWGGMDAWDSGWTMPGAAKGGSIGGGFFGQGCSGWPQPAATPMMGPAPPPILNVAVDQTSQLPVEGYLTEAPCISFDKTHGIFSCAKDLISEVTRDASDVVVDHDCDWQKYPEVAEAVKLAGGEENCVAVAKCPSQFKWAVGLGSGWKGREQAALVSLSVALASGTEKMPVLARKYPEFHSMCSAAGLLPEDDGFGAEMMGMPQQYQEFAPQPVPQAVAGWEGGPMAGTNCPPVHWIDLAPDSQIPMRGFPGSAPVVAYGGKEFKEFFSNAHYILSELIADVGQVMFTDDPDWKVFPEVAKAIEAAGGEENCYCVATSETVGVWAVGLAAGKKPRESAAKMALALALTSSPNVPNVVRNYPEFGTLMQAAGLEVPGMDPAAKKRRFSGV